MLIECPKCKYGWTARVKIPVACPSCKRYLHWDKVTLNEVKSEVIKNESNRILSDTKSLGYS